jgi:hypothetical protein
VNRSSWRRLRGSAAVCLLGWALLFPCLSRAAEEAYIVRRGDSIYSIARSYGIPSTVLGDYNGLSHSYHVYAGERLRVPLPAGAKPPTPTPAPAPRAAARRTLPRSIQRAIDKAPVAAGRWKYIVIHHSGVNTGTPQAMDQYHREVRHMENGLAYHFVIGNGSGMGDGEIFVGHRWTAQLAGGHLASEAQNEVALGICLVGNFDEHPPSAKQLASLRALIEALLFRCKLPPSAVKTHQQINIVYTRCPGAKFPTEAFLASLKGSPGGGTRRPSR